MSLDKELIFFFSGLGIFNSLILSVYFLFFPKSKHRSNYFLGGLLIALSIRVGKSLFFYFNPDLSKIYLQIGLSACFFIGPFLFFYLKSKVNHRADSDKYDYYQLLLLLLVTVGVGVLYPYERYIILWTEYLYRLIYLQWLIYIIASGLLLKSTFQKLISPKEKLNYDEVWLLSVFFGTSIIWIAYNTASYTSYIVGALSFSFVFYLSGLLIFFKRKKDFVVAPFKEKYADVQIEEDEAKQWLEKIEQTITEQGLFKNPNLTLPVLAKEVNIRPQLLSQLLNNNLNKSFSQYVNEYRIQEAKLLLRTHASLKVEVIAEKSGFNSKSTFYTAFKKVTGTTPAQYIK